ncbi:hypothetical protein M1105_02540 [Limibaculum sp. FT325]|uniref:hypothetical protein n=1 Tax=Thermohalobaculum sediminis TaxID=2939436 RepID=UPI0020BEF4F9|nr:hypothetical protein [Limibaculum sediminis]MCL5775878.1 hypothetical protein [Limibaculum sediminis]
MIFVTRQSSRISIIAVFIVAMALSATAMGGHANSTEGAAAEGPRHIGIDLPSGFVLQRDPALGRGERAARFLKTLSSGHTIQIEVYEKDHHFPRADDKPDSFAAEWHAQEILRSHMWSLNRQRRAEESLSVKLFNWNRHELPLPTPKDDQMIFCTDSHFVYEEHLAAGLNLHAQSRALHCAVWFRKREVDPKAAIVIVLVQVSLIDGWIPERGGSALSSFEKLVRTVIASVTIHS